MNRFTIIAGITIGLSMLFAVEGQAQIELPQPEVEALAPLGMTLQRRQSVRTFSEDEIPMEQLSTILWAAYGINRPEEQRRTVPSARNVQELNIYLFNKDGVYLYNAEKNILEPIANGDYRSSISRQPHFKQAPYAIVIAVDYNRMKDFDDEGRNFFSAVDAGYVSQDIYLACASFDLGTVACGAIERDKLNELLKLNNGKALLAHPIGIAIR